MVDVSKIYHHESSLFNRATFSFPQTTTSLKTNQTILLVVSSPCSPICPTKTDHGKPAFCFTSSFITTHSSSNRRFFWDPRAERYFLGKVRNQHLTMFVPSRPEKRSKRNPIKLIHLTGKLTFLTTKSWMWMVQMIFLLSYVIFR